jgi:GT2 family glycosyltransferase
LALTIDIARANPEVGMIYTEHTIIDENGIEQGLGYRCQIPYHRDRLLVDFICHHFRLIRRDIYELIGGLNSDFIHAEDYDLVLRIAEVTEIYQLKIPLYQYRVHNKSMGTTHRIEQIELAARAVRAALVRRKLDRDYYLDVSPTYGFQIKLIQY